MPDEIKPALTREEWSEKEHRISRREVMSGGKGFVIDGPDPSDSVYVDSPDDLAAAVALANDALPDGHPLKITREDVAALHVVLSGYGSEFVEDGKGDVARCERLAAKLAALLPPEG